MEAVKAFTFELYSIMEMKPPISKAKMTAITRNAIKAIKLYKHVVQCVEKFIQKCKPEYKIPGLYVIDSIVRQSRHQFGNDKDVFAPRFARNLKSTFTHLFACPEEDKSKVIRVLNLWQKNAVFTTDVIQPIFDLAANPAYGEHSQTNTLSSMDNSPKLSVKTDLFKSQENTPIKEEISKNIDILQLQSSEENKPLDPAILEHIQAIQSLLKKQPGQPTMSTSPQVKKSDGMKLFDKKILDYDYGDDEEEMLNQSPEFQQQQQQQHQNNTMDGLDSLLSNPEVLRTLRNVEGLMSTQSKQQAELDKIKEMRKEAEFDKHLAQAVQNLPFASECELKPTPIVSQSVGIIPNPYTNQLFSTQIYQQSQALMPLETQQKPLLLNNAHEDPNQLNPEVIDLDHIDSPPQTNKRESRRDGYLLSLSRKRSPRKSSRERQKERERDRERDRERRKKYLPPFKKNHLAVVSTTLWVGHLSKLIHQDDLYGLFQPIGDIISLNLISPRGCAFLCMNRRQDAARIMNKYQGERLQGKPMTIAWAPGQAMKDKEWKDYWEIDDGVSYIPWEKLNKDIDFDELEVGGMLDEDTMPEWLKTHLKNLRTTKKIEKKEEEKLVEGSQQPPLSASNFFETQGLQSPSVQMQMSPAQNTQPTNQMNFNIPPTMNMPGPFGINPRLINPMMNPMIPGTMTPMAMPHHPSMMMMNRMPSPFGPPPNMAMMGNPQQMPMSNDPQKSLGVPPDMMMTFPFGMNLPSQAATISSAQTIMGINPPTVTSGTSTAPTISQNTSQNDSLSTPNPSNHLDPPNIMQFNLPPPPTLPILSDFTQNAINTKMEEKYDPNILGNSDQDDSNDVDAVNEIDDRNHGRNIRNRSHDSRERNDRFNERENKNDRGRRDDLSQRQDPRNRMKGPEQRERKSSRWGDKINDGDNRNNIERLSVKEGLVMPHAPNLAQIDNSLHQILENAIQDNIGNPPFQSGMFGPNGPLPNQIFSMPPQGLGQDGPRPHMGQDLLMDNGNMRGRGGWNRGGSRGGFRGRVGFNNGPIWDNNSGPNWDNNGVPNWGDNSGPPPVWQNQSMNRGGMMGRGNLRPPLMQNIMGRGRDNWMENNLAVGRGGRDPDNWGGRGGGRDMDSWGGRGGGRDSDGWGGRGNRLSPWRGNGNRRRNDDWEAPNKKRWRRDDNSEWDEQQKPWKRGPMIDEEEEKWKTKVQGPQWGVKKEEGNFSKFRNRDEERSRKQSKWVDKESENKVKIDPWNIKSVEYGLSNDESNTEEGPHRTSAPMDLDNYEGETLGKIEQLHEVEENDTSNSNIDIRRHKFKNEYHQDKIKKTHDLSNFNNAKSYDQSKEKNVEQHNNEHHHFEDRQNDFSNSPQLLKPSNIEEIRTNLEIQHQDNSYEQQNIEEKHNDSDYQTDFHKNLNSEFESSQNKSEFEQNHFEPSYNSVNHETQKPNDDQSYECALLLSSTSQDQHSVNNFVAQVNEANKEKYRNENPEESQGNLYFALDSGSSINKSVTEQQSNRDLQIEGKELAPPDNNHVNTEESNQN
ncbi:RNA polymerase II-binding domain,ENTH/VHS,CID domain,RNA recognition motif domain [Cinara cedri]|uniref:RNA polymerase II-binding domain,ENTH/VHS,CID domain,RNA recognition motif domain n=1 Tax=Cinara cedri TaxID=506608 RepID=A0A5E4MY33_9HEMI|nr:RNA polymerase II-binding domain,ENTH/VHS,CID domain,RNA recognition motif domain [Cinara cedri]